MADDKFTGLYSKYNEDDLPGQNFETYDEQYVKELLEENRKLQEELAQAKTRDAWPEVNGAVEAVSPPAGHNELVKRLRYLDDYAKTDRHTTTIFGQAAHTITLLQKALAAMEELAAAQDEKVRGLERENGELKVRHGVVPSVEELLKQIKEQDRKIQGLERENIELRHPRKKAK